MSDFCKQCSKDLGAPEGWSDLNGIGPGVEVLCEGCGWIEVDDSGSCQGCAQHPIVSAEQDLVEQEEQP